jgi:hypothetical protein
LTLKPQDEDMETHAVSKLASATGAQAVNAALKRASEATGAGFEVLYNMARRESSLDPAAKAKTSSAAGLFQFIEQTWLGAVKNYGARHGLGAEAAAITATASGKLVVADATKREDILNLRFDPAKAAALAGELVQENKAGLENRLGRAVDAAEVYAAHFLGLGGAVKLLRASPDANAAELLPAAAAANRNVFYDGDRAKTIKEVMASLAKSMNVAAGSSEGRAPSIAETAVKAAAAETGAPQLRDPTIGESAPSARRIPRKLEKKSVDVFATAGMPSLKPLLSPLTLAVLQALDPTRLGVAGQNEPRDKR